MNLKSENITPEHIFILSHLLNEPVENEIAEYLEVELKGDEKQEFSELFKIPTGRFVPPYLAANQNSISPQEYQLTLKNFFKEGDFVLKEKIGERPDHIGVVLEFVSLQIPTNFQLAEKTWNYVKKDIVNFAKKLDSATESPVYKKLSENLIFLGEKSLKEFV